MSETTKKRSLDKLFGVKDVRDAPSMDAPTPVGSSLAPEQPTETRSARPDDDVGPGGYLGEGRYRRGDGVLAKASIYMRPDQARALRVAAAHKTDEHGKSMSEIIQSLLDLHGYCDPSARRTLEM